MKIKYVLLFTILFILVFVTVGCGSSQIYSNPEYGFTFKVSNLDLVTETSSGVTVELSDKVTVAVFSNDISQSVDPYYQTILTQDELDLRSGAFESNYNNTLFISQLIDYLFADSENAYSVYGVRESTFNQYDAWCADIVSNDEPINGQIYICVENARSYIIVIYIYDDFDNRFAYDTIIEKFIDSFYIDE